MEPIHILLVAVAMFGFLPLLIIIYKRKLVARILTTGTRATAKVYRIHTSRKPPQEIVSYSFAVPGHDKQATGVISTDIGRYKVGDTIEVYYLPGNPKRNTIDGAWGSRGFLIFGWVIGISVLFMVFKLATSENL